MNPTHLRARALWWSRAFVIVAIQCAAVPVFSGEAHAQCIRWSATKQAHVGSPVNVSFSAFSELVSGATVTESHVHYQFELQAADPNNEVFDLAVTADQSDSEWRATFTPNKPGYWSIHVLNFERSLPPSPPNKATCYQPLEVAVDVPARAASMPTGPMSKNAVPLGFYGAIVGAAGLAAFLVVVGRRRRTARGG